MSGTVGAEETLEIGAAEEEEDVIADWGPDSGGMDTESIDTGAAVVDGDEAGGGVELADGSAALVVFVFAVVSSSSTREDAVVSAGEVGTRTGAGTGGLVLCDVGAGGAFVPLPPLPCALKLGLAELGPELDCLSLVLIFDCDELAVEVKSRSRFL